MVIKTRQRPTEQGVTTDEDLQHPAPTSPSLLVIQLYGQKSGAGRGSTRLLILRSLRIEDAGVGSNASRFGLSRGDIQAVKLRSSQLASRAVPGQKPGLTGRCP